MAVCAPIAMKHNFVGNKFWSGCNFDVVLCTNSRALSEKRKMIDNASR